MKQKFLALLSAAVALGASFCGFGCAAQEDSLVLRVANWEEYIDLGDWDEEEAIGLENPFLGEDVIFGENSMIDDFTEWFNAQDYGFEVSVEYSTFGTNEDLYNRLNLGDVYDLVCPSEYMIMKLIAEDRIQPFSEDFKNPDVEHNYYAQYVSSYIDCAEDSIFVQHGWDRYAACYMWGTTGFVFHPDEIENETDVDSWSILTNSDYAKRVTVKDNVRDAYFAALGILNSEALLAEGIDGEARSALLNATDAATIAGAEDILKEIKRNVYSFETDSGKSDMVTGKVIANYQWSGDAVYILDIAEDENDVELWYSVPQECTNLYFDGWTMLKAGVEGDEKKQIAAEAFVNFLSRPDNAVRNMYYIGYTSSIAGDLVFDYMDYNYGAVLDPESEDYCELTALYEYDLSYFFGKEALLYADIDSLDAKGAVRKGTISEGGVSYDVYEGGTISHGRQLLAQYPTEEIIDRSVIMLDFGDRLSEINQMWINVRCLDLKDINPAVLWPCVVLAVAALALLFVYLFRNAIPGKKK